MALTSEPALKPLNRLVGSWTTEATHPALPGVIVRGSADIEWLEGERFLIQRARNDHPQFPDSISIIGFTRLDRVGPGAAAPSDHRLTMHYYDSRGVFRECEASVDDRAWRIVRITKGFSQRFTGTFADGGATIVGVWQLCEDEINWNDDLKITYRRRA
jgi:hypothetical protein